MRAFLWVFGLVSIANAVWMLVSPEVWYHELPAGVPDTGPLNLHFVRDVGAAYLTAGVSMCAAAEISKYRRPLVMAAAIFFTMHAAIHVFDLLTGLLPPEHWLIDLPGVFLPAIALAVASMPRWWSDETV